MIAKQGQGKQCTTASSHGHLDCCGYTATGRMSIVDSGALSHTTNLWQGQTAVSTAG